MVATLDWLNGSITASAEIFFCAFLSMSTTVVFWGVGDGVTGVLVDVSAVSMPAGLAAVVASVDAGRGCASNVSISL